MSVVRPAVPPMIVRAVKWQRDLERLGIHTPLGVVHDLGLLYAAPKEQLVMGARPALEIVAPAGSPTRALVIQYREMIDEIAASEASVKARSLRLGDDLVVVVLARMLASMGAREETRPPYTPAVPFDPELVRDLDPQLAALWGSVPRTFDLEMLRAMVRSRLYMLTLADAIDVDTLRLLGMLGAESGAASALAQVDLLAAMSTPEANDIVNFSLELLPSVLETRRARAAGTQAVSGYAGVGGKGSLDSMVLTELAWDDEELARRIIEGELLFYTRDESPEPARRLHYVLIDASASMRGDRQVFARGLAIALGKKLQLAGEEVWFRFFDSRLYDVQRALPRQLPAAVPARVQGGAGEAPGARVRAARDRAFAGAIARAAGSGRSPGDARHSSTCRARSWPTCGRRPTCSRCSSSPAVASSTWTTSICWTATPWSITRRSNRRTPVPPPPQRSSTKRRP